MDIKDRKITINYVRKKYPEKYKSFTDQQLQQKIDLYYQISYISITNTQDSLRQKLLLKKETHEELQAKSNNLYKSIVRKAD